MYISKHIFDTRRFKIIKIDKIKNNRKKKLINLKKHNQTLQHIWLSIQGIHLVNFLSPLYI